MEGFNQWINTYNSSDLISKYQEKQAKFDEALKNSRDWNNEWYKKRATLPQFKDVATERLNTSNQLSTELSDPINLSIDWWNKTGKPPEVFYAPEIGGITRNNKAKININNIRRGNTDIEKKDSEPFFENAYFTDAKGKLQNSLITHEENHERDFIAPQIGTKQHVNKFKWGEGNNLDPIEKIITKEEQLNDDRNIGYSNSYQQQPTEVRSRLQVWRQINNIDPLKKYSNEEIDKIIKSNLNNPNINSDIKELLETLKNDPEKLNYLNNTYVSINNNNQLPIAKMGGMMRMGGIQKFDEGGDFNNYKKSNLLDKENYNDSFGFSFPESNIKTKSILERNESLKDLDFSKKYKINRDSPYNSKLKFEHNPNIDYGLGLNNSSSSISGGVKFLDKNPQYNINANKTIGNFTGNINSSFNTNPQNNVSLNYNNKGLNVGAGILRKDAENVYRTNAGYNSNNFGVNANYVYNKNDKNSHLLNINANAKKGNLGIIGNYGYNNGQNSGGLNLNYNKNNLGVNVGANYNKNNGLGANFNVIKKFEEGGIEDSINKSLGNPMLKAEIDSDYKRPTVDPRTRRQHEAEPVDNVRHAAAGRYTQEAIENYANLIPYTSAIPGFSKAAGFIGANILGLGHEASTLFNKNDDDTRTMGMKVKESAADAYNNMIGSVIGASNLTPYQKNAYIKYLSETGKIPTGQYNKKKDPIYKKQTNKK